MMYTKLIEAKVTRVSRVMELKSMSMVAIIYIAGNC